MLTDAVPRHAYHRRRLRRAAGRVALAAITACAGLLWLSGDVYGGTSAPDQRVTVHAGDTLWSLAAQHYPGDDVRGRVAEIETANHLQSSQLSAGQQLLLPAP